MVVRNAAPNNFLTIPRTPIYLCSCHQYLGSRTTTGKLQLSIWVGTRPPGRPVSSRRKAARRGKCALPNYNL